MGHIHPTATTTTTTIKTTTGKHFQTPTSRGNCARLLPCPVAMTTPSQYNDELTYNYCFITKPLCC